MREPSQKKNQRKFSAATAIFESINIIVKWKIKKRTIHNVTVKYFENCANCIEHYAISYNPQKSVIFSLFDHISIAR